MKLLYGLSIPIFLGMEGVLYLTFLGIDLFCPGGDTVGIKYGCIALCLAMAVLWGFRGGDRLTAAALGFTLAADTFLLLLDRHYQWGVALFCGAHVLYFLRIGRSREDRRVPWLMLALPAVLMLVLLKLRRGDSLTAVSAGYAGLLLLNVVSSAGGNGIKKRLLFIGLALLLCCDMCVAIHNLSEFFPETVNSFANIGMWLFYLPSQTCIVLSALPESQFKRVRR